MCLVPRETGLGGLSSRDKSGCADPRLPSWHGQDAGRAEADRWPKCGGVVDVFDHPRLMRRAKEGSAGLEHPYLGSFLSAGIDNGAGTLEKSAESLMMD